MCGGQLNDAMLDWELMIFMDGAMQLDLLMDGAMQLDLPVPAGRGVFCNAAAAHQRGLFGPTFRQAKHPGSQQRGVVRVLVGEAFVTSPRSPHFRSMS